MRKARAAELVLGSVQLGLSYGAANKTGKPSRAAALRMVDRAVEAGIGQIDTARAYGDSENRLGDALRARHAVRTITKLSPLSELVPEATRDSVRAAVDASIAESLAALKKDRLDCLLLHRASHMTDFDGAIWERLVERLEDGTVLALGVSVQSPEEALIALEHSDVRHIQMPFNILDWRWREAGVIERIRAREHVTVHVRSVFLQGLLAAGEPEMWPRVRGLDAHAVVKTLQHLAREFKRESVADLCVAYARGQDWVDGVVVGMETEEQLDANLRLFLKHPLSPADCAKIEKKVPRVPAQVLDPAQWPRIF